MKKNRNKFHNKQIHLTRDVCRQVMYVPKPKKLKLTGSEGVDNLLAKRSVV